MARKTQIHAAELLRANARSGTKFGEGKTLDGAPRQLTVSGNAPIYRSLTEAYITGVFGGGRSHERTGLQGDFTNNREIYRENRILNC